MLGRWFVVRAADVLLFTAGIRQLVQPALGGEAHASLSVVIPGLDPGTRRSRPVL